MDTWVITRREDKLLSLLFRENRLILAKAHPTDEEGVIGSIYVGKVKNVVKNIQAAFVEIEPGRLCFLPLKNLDAPFLTNRIYDGRLLEGDELLVQLERAAVKTKEAVVNSRLSVSGRYAVLTTGRTGLGFSNKLTKSVKDWLRKVLQENAIWEQLQSWGVIIRTNTGKLLEEPAKDPDAAPLFADLAVLDQKLRRILETGSHRTCFSCLYRPEPAYVSTLRDAYEKDFCVVTDDPSVYETLQQYQKMLGTDPQNDRLRLYQDTALSLSKLYSVETRLQEALASRVWLKSGGYLVIEPTEALTVIDVNTGKYSGNKDRENTFYQINREAAKEIALQLRLRNLSGIILVDFINMENKEREQELLRYLKELFLQDNVKTVAVDMTALGLVEITRKKGDPPLAEQLCR